MTSYDYDTNAMRLEPMLDRKRKIPQKTFLSFYNKI